MRTVLIWGMRAGGSAHFAQASSKPGSRRDALVPQPCKSMHEFPHSDVMDLITHHG
jgi:hypothetical protein